MSVPARIGACRSAMAEVRVKRGSTWMSFAPFACACRAKRKAMGWASAMLEPMTRMQSAWARSHCGMVAAPRPKDVPRLGTELAWQMRAWFSIPTMPRPPPKTFLIR